MDVFDILSMSKRCTSSFGHKGTKKALVTSLLFVAHAVMKSFNLPTTFNDFKFSTKHDSGKGLSNHCVLVGQGQLYQPV